MQQRRVRLGDILDDYCPRERRITNHVVVAMIDDGVKQTRCTTCDADHEYKQARIPAQRRKKAEGGTTDAVEGALRPRPMDEAPIDEAGDAEEMTDVPELDAGSTEPTDPLDASVPDDALVPEAPAVATGPEDDGPVHRRLIRATLPRQEGQLPERKDPDFTIRQPGRGRDFDSHNNGQRHGRRPMRTGPGGGGSQPSRFGGPPRGSGGPRQGSGPGQRPAGNRPGQPGGPRGNRPGSGPGRAGGGSKRGR